MGVTLAVCPLEAPDACNIGHGTFSVVDLGGRRAVDIGWACLLYTFKLITKLLKAKVW